MRYRPLLMMRTRGLAGTFLRKHANSAHALSRSVGAFMSAGDVPTGPPEIAFMGAYKASTSVQGVNAEGDILNILPRGTVGATSVHNAPILAPDYQGIYQEYAVDSPVWKGGRVDAGETYATDGIGGDLQPFLQCNEDSTNLMMGVSSWIPSNSPILTENYGIGITAELDTIFIDDNIATDASIRREGISTPTPHAGIIIFRKQPAPFTHTVQFNIAPATKRVQVDPVTGAILDRDPGKGGEFQLVDKGDWWWFCWGDTTTTGGMKLFPAINNTGPDGSIGTGIGGIEVAYVGLQEGYDYLTIQDAPIIPTTTAEASIPKTQYTYPAANIPDLANAVIKITLDYAGETDANVMDIGGLLTLKYVASQLTLSDGANSVAVAITAGQRDITMTLTATQMTLDVDAVKVSGAYIPVASGIITVEEDHWGLSV